MHRLPQGESLSRVRRRALLLRGDRALRFVYVRLVESYGDSLSAHRVWHVWEAPRYAILLALSHGFDSSCWLRGLGRLCGLRQSIQVVTLGIVSRLGRVFGVLRLRVG